MRLLVKEGASVHVVMTANAQQFVTPLTFQALSNNAVGTDLFSMESESRISHIQKARLPDLVLIAPATANLMAKMAAGIADDYLTTILLATTAPVLVCPAMNVKMWEHPATQRNLRTLAELGYEIQPPGVGSLACQEEGAGRLAEIADILERAVRMLTPPTLAGRRVLVSAGPTWEPFDPVRFLSNPSSGKMGYALAKIAARRSARVHLVSGPCFLDAPAGVERTCVTSALEMRDVIAEAFSSTGRHCNGRRRERLPAIGKSPSEAQESSRKHSRSSSSPILTFSPLLERLSRRLRCWSDLPRRPKTFSKTPKTSWSERTSISSWPTTFPRKAPGSAATQTR